jgi:branched-chain amino acid transport system permease protein
MVVFSALLLIVVIYRQQGLMGKREFSWDAIFDAALPRLKGLFPARKNRRAD